MSKAISPDLLDQEIVITQAKRTPIGAFQGVLSPFTGTDLGAHCIKSVLGNSKLKNTQIDEVIMGCVLPAGLGQAPARQAAIKAELAPSTRCLTINKVCGSGLKSVMMAYDTLRLGESRVIIAGGMESMTNAPHLLPGSRNGFRLGSAQIIDHMMHDGLEDSFSNGSAMGLLADRMAEAEHLSREEQDTFAISSGKKALKAQEQGFFQDEITPLVHQTRKGPVEINHDEPPSKVLFEKIPDLRPVFRKEGTLTAANSSSIADGAAALMLMNRTQAKALKQIPLAVIKGHASFSREPEWFTLAPIGAMKALMEKVGWSVKDVDLFEINEAFACVTMAAIKNLGIPEEKVNVHGGACALGHPIGASGGRLLVTLVHALERHNKKRGIVSLCIGGGEGVALAIERP